MREPSLWCKEVKKAMIDQNVRNIDLAKAIGVAPPMASAVVTGRYYSEERAEQISKYLGVTIPYSV